MTQLPGTRPGARRAPRPEPTAATALAERERVRRSLDGPHLLAAVVEDSCTWYGYLAILLCRIDEPRAQPHLHAQSEEGPAGR